MNIRHLILLCFATIGLTLLSCSTDPESPSDSSATLPTVASVSDVGVVGTPPNVAARDGGASARMGSTILWLFGDTFFNPKSVDGTNYRTNTTALAPIGTPLETTESLDANGAPFQGVPFTSDEIAYNQASGKPDERIALWPGGLHATDDGGAVGFIHKLYVHPGGLNYEHIGVELADFAPGSATAVRAGNLFTVIDPIFTMPMEREEYLYLYGMLVIDGSKGVGVARAPVAKFRDRSAYEAWDGSGWNIDLSKAATLFSSVPGAVTISWNSYLNQYIAVHSLPLGNRVVMRVAPAPEGPWSDPIDLFTGKTPDSGFDYAGMHHPELDEDGGRVIYVSYYHPLPGFLQGELVMMRVELEFPIN